MLLCLLTRPHKPMLAEWTSKILSLSPGGKLALSCTRFYIAKYGFESGPGPWQLFHSDLDMANGACEKLKVVSRSANRTLQGVAWHPALQYRQIYAVLNEKASLFIVDGLAHKLLAQRSWQEISRSASPTCISSREACKVKMLWSPDGTQLAALAHGFTALVSAVALEAMICWAAFSNLSAYVDMLQSGFFA